MLEIDPYKTWQLLDERLKTEKNPLHRAHIETIIYHFKGEARGDVDQIVSTLSPKSCYHVYDHAGGGVPRVYNGIDGARQWYSELLGTISADLEYRVESLIVDDYSIVTEGPTKVAIPGKVLESAGIKVSEPDGLYLGGGRTIVIWPFDQDGLILGEKIYSVGTASLEKVATRKLHPDEIGRYLEAA
jgi:hypothetical protein